jgi:hypothetical protein
VLTPRRFTSLAVAVADNGGVHAAMVSYANATGATDLRLFFVAYAQGW